MRRLAKGEALPTWQNCQVGAGGCVLHTWEDAGLPFEAGRACRLQSSADAERLGQCSHQRPGLYLHQPGLGYVRDVLALGDAALKPGSECSFTTSKLRFLASFRLAYAARPDLRSKPFRTQPRANAAAPSCNMRFGGLNPTQYRLRLRSLTRPSFRCSDQP